MALDSNNRLDHPLSAFDGDASRVHLRREYDIFHALHASETDLLIKHTGGHLRSIPSTVPQTLDIDSTSPTASTVASINIPTAMLLGYGPPRFSALGNYTRTVQNPFLRFRIGYSLFPAHLLRIHAKGVTSDKCQDCGDISNRDHVLLDCPRFGPRGWATTGEEFRDEKELVAWIGRTRAGFGLGNKAEGRGDGGRSQQEDSVVSGTGEGLEGVDIRGQNNEGDHEEEDRIEIILKRLHMEALEEVQDKANGL